MRAVSDTVQEGYALYLCIIASFNSGDEADDTNPNPQILMYTLLQLLLACVHNQAAVCIITVSRTRATNRHHDGHDTLTSN